MQYFDDSFIDFFSNLEKNNNRDWFNANKSIFLDSVKKPFDSFIETLLNEIKQHDDSILISPKEAIFRIYKDVRFSKDKLPYKTFISAIISEGGRKDLTSPGYYIELNSKEIKFYCGSHFLEKNQLQNLREFIADNLATFADIISNKKFQRNFGKMLGDKNKRVPSEFKELLSVQPLIANKQFYFAKKFDGKVITSKVLVSKIVKAYLDAKPFVDFLKMGINS